MEVPINVVGWHSVDDLCQAVGDLASQGEQFDQDGYHPGLDPGELG